MNSRHRDSAKTRSFPALPALRRRVGFQRRLALALLGVVVLLAAPGCLVMGRRQVDHPVDSTRLGKIEPGMPKAEVTALLGAPQEIVFSNKDHDPLREHAYVYEFVMTKFTGLSFGIINFGNADEKRDRVVVFLDDEGNVESVGASLYGTGASYGFPFGK